MPHPPSHSAIVLLAGVLLGVLVPASTAQAQVTAADSAAVVLETAQRFERRGDDDVARVLYRYIAERWPGTPAGRRASLRLQTREAGGDAGSGNVELQVWATLYGLWMGVAIPAALGADGGEPYGLGLLAGGPAGFFGGRALAQALEPTEGQARAITFGDMWGGWQGLGWREVFDWGVERTCDMTPDGEYCYNAEDSSEETFAAMVLGSVAGVAVGSALARRPIPAGVAATVNFGALWGTWFGLAGGILLDLEGDALLAATLLGGNAGLAATLARAPAWNPSRNRARLVSIAGVIGGLGGLGIDLLAGVDDEKTAVAVPLATSLAGLAVGRWATRDYDRRPDGRVERGSGPGAPGAALIRVDAGRLGAGVPLPYPVVLERPDAAGRPNRVMGLGLTVLSARF